METRIIVLEANVAFSRFWIDFWVGISRFYVTIPFVKSISPFIEEVAKRLIRVKVVEKFE